MRSWEMSTLVVNVQIRAFGPTSKMTQIWCSDVMVATVGEGQKKFRLAPDTVVRRMLHFAVIWVTVFPKVGYFA